MEEKILKSFRKYMGKEVENINLLVSIPDTFEYEYQCEVLEKEDNGRVWLVQCTRNGNVKDVCEI